MTDHTGSTTRLGVTLHRALRNELEEMARASDRSLAAEVRTAIRMYLPWAREQRRAAELDEEERHSYQC